MEEFIGGNPIVLQTGGILIAEAYGGMFYTFDDDRKTYDTLRRGRLCTHNPSQPYGDIFMHPCGKDVHRLLNPDCPPEMVVDHINGDKRDNRKLNLRCVSRRVNAINAKQRVSRLNHTGISPSKSGGFVAKWTAADHKEISKTFNVKAYGGDFDLAFQAAKDFLARKKRELPHYREALEVAWPPPNLAKMDVRYLLNPLIRNTP